MRGVGDGRNMAVSEIDKNRVRVVIMHGYNSSCQNERYLGLPFATFGGNVLHDQHSWRQVCEIYEKLLEEAGSGFDGRLILLGHSLGGWWARYFARKYDLAAVLLNPLADIHAIVDDRIPDAAAYAEKQLEMASWPERGQLTFYIEQPDDVIDYSKMLPELHKEGRVIVKHDGDHRIKWPENIAPMLLEAARAEIRRRPD